MLIAPASDLALKVLTECFAGVTPQLQNAYNSAANTAKSVTNGVTPQLQNAYNSATDTAKSVTNGMLISPAHISDTRILTASFAGVTPHIQNAYENASEQSAATSAEMSNLAAARHPPNYRAATGQQLTNYHSFFSELLSWRNPRMSLGATAIHLGAGADTVQGRRPLRMARSSRSSSCLGTWMFCAGRSSSPIWLSAPPSPPRSLANSS